MNDTHGSDGVAVGQSHKKFETIFRYANDAILIVDVEKDIIADCNPAAVGLFGYSREELLSMSASDLHPHNTERFEAFTDGVLEQGAGWTDDLTCYCKDGDLIPAQMSASLVELDGRPYVINHVRETSDREERERFEALLEHSGDLITVMKGDGTVRYQSDSVGTVLGYDSDGLQDATYFEYVHPDDVDDLRETLDRMASQSGAVVERLEYRFRRAGGSWAWIEGIVSHRPESVVSGFLVNARDVTPRRESQQQAEVLNRILRHNLRNELTAIAGWAGQLADADAEPVASAAERILSSASELRRLTSYTKDLDDMIGSHDVSRHRQELEPIVRETMETLSETFPDAEFRRDVPEGLAAAATPKLDFAIEHVLRNAVEHNDRESPRVDVTARPPATGTESGYVELTVADDGPGIPSQEREVLLEGDEEPLRHGSGLGLWIVNWVVTRSGGYVAFDTNEPRGSRVSLYLPRG